MNFFFQNLIDAISSVLLQDRFLEKTRNEIDEKFDKLLKIPDVKIQCRPTLELQSINPFFKDATFVMNYISELSKL